VVVFNYPPNPKVNYIKRVIGVAGDVVEYRNKRLTINGKAVPDEKDGTYDYLEQGMAMIHNDQFKEVMDGKSYKVLNIPDAPVVALGQVADFPRVISASMMTMALSARCLPGITSCWATTVTTAWMAATGVSSMIV
jgi:hypothetical protein